MALPSGCCLLSPPSLGVFQLSENAPKSSKRLQAAEKYLSSEVRVPFKLVNREKSLTFLSRSLHSTPKEQDDRRAACSYCSPRLWKLLPAFQAAGIHGVHLHYRKLANSTGQHGNYKQDNEWLLQNVFDSHGNYIFCDSCILAWINVHKGRLSKLRNTKRDLNLSPVHTITRSTVEKEGLLHSVVMLEDQSISLQAWWQTLEKGHTLKVRYPYGRHGLKGKVSNRHDNNAINVSGLQNSEQWVIIRKCTECILTM